MSNKEEEAILRHHLQSHDLMLGQDDVRAAGLRCVECNNPKTVYYIKNPLMGFFKGGAYCYPCLRKCCRLVRGIPFPIETWLLDSLKADLGLTGKSPTRITYH